MGDKNLKNEGRNSNLWLNGLKFCQMPKQNSPGLAPKGNLFVLFSAAKASCYLRIRAKRSSMYLPSPPATYGGPERPLSFQEHSIEKLRHHPLGIHKSLQTSRTLPHDSLQLLPDFPPTQRREVLCRFCHWCIPRI